MIKVEQRPIYITSDDKEFFYEKDAIEHETKLALIEKLEESNISYYHTSAEEIAVWIIKNYKTIKELMK